MRLTQKRNGKNVIPLLMAACGIDLPYWRIDKADDLHSYLSGEAADKLAAYEDAEEQGRLVTLNTAPQDKYGGLKRKYIVFKSDTGEPVEGSFVLRPDRDATARIALEAYARATENKELADDIIRWIGDSGKTVCVHCTIKAFNDAADAIEELSKPRWIPVTERMPTGGDDSGAICENVCLLMDDGTVSCGWMNGITKKVYYLNARDDVVIKAPITRVTHWMPLPEPPKEET